MSPAKIFISYAHEDKEYLEELLKHLRLIERQGFVKCWHDREITAGTEWKGAIDKHLKEADVALMLISVDFVSSDYCYDIEMQAAIDGHKEGSKLTIPILIRPVANWLEAPFGKLQALPSDTVPVSNADYKEAAWAGIAAGILKAIQRREQEQLLRETRAEPDLDKVFQKSAPELNTGDEKGTNINESIGDDQIGTFLWPIPKMRSKLEAYKLEETSYQVAAKQAHADIMEDFDLPLEIRMTAVLGKLSDILQKKIALDIQLLSIVETIVEANLSPTDFNLPSYEAASKTLKTDMSNRDGALYALAYFALGVPIVSSED